MDLERKDVVCVGWRGGKGHQAQADQGETQFSQHGWVPPLGIAIGVYQESPARLGQWHLFVSGDSVQIDRSWERAVVRFFLGALQRLLEFFF